MATTEKLQEPRLGEPGEPCAECGSPLAADQHYCLNCGQRRGDPRVAYDKHLNNGGNGGSAPPEAGSGSASESGRDWTPYALVGLVAALGMMLAVGVLIGKNGSGSDQAAAPPVVQVGGGTGTDTGTGSNLPTANTSFESDWPAGKQGWTVEIGTLAKQGATGEQVEAAKSDASDKGAPDVGALDSDEFASLPTGNYVIYSGVYDAKADATKALKPLKSDFPDAKVIEISSKGGAGGGEVVSAAATGGLTSGKADKDATVKASKEDLEQLGNLSGQDYVDAANRLPNNIQTPGKPPPKDNKEPGAGTPSQVIK